MISPCHVLLKGQLSRATGQISASLFGRHQPEMSGQSRRMWNLNEPKGKFRFTDFAVRWAPGFHLFARFSSLTCPKAITSAFACNYPQSPYAVWEEWKGLTSFWPSAAHRFLSHPSLSSASPIANSSLRGLSVLVSLSLSHYSLVCNVCMLLMCLLQLFHPVISLSAGFFHCL